MDPVDDDTRAAQWTEAFDSSDEEEEYRENFQRLFRKRTAADARVEAAVRGAVLRKRARVATRQGRSGGKGSVGGLGGVGVLLGVEEVEEDLAALFGAGDKGKFGRGVRRVARRTAGGKEFVKHGERKGWVVCVCCETEVWPPNINKHKAACSGR